MPKFELQVEFVGISLNVVHSDKKRVAVLLPDARTKGPYIDGKEAEPHVGYLRFALAFVDSSVPLGDLDDPMSAVVHRLDQEVIDFGLTDDGTNIDITELFAPQLECTDTQEGAARDIELLPGLFGTNPPNLLARCILTNGVFHAQADGALWAFSDALRKSGEPFETQITHKEVWKRDVEGKDLKVTLTRFDKSASRSVVLKPVSEGGKDVIRVKIGNLCAGNPLEWDTFDDPEPISIDNDFKWAYNLVRSTTTDPIKKRLKKKVLPAPKRNGGAAGVRNCPGASIAADF